MPGYLEEKFDKEFYDFCKLIWKFNKTGKKKILELYEKYPDKKFLIIKNRRDINKLFKAWMEEFKNT